MRIETRDTKICYLRYFGCPTYNIRTMKGKDVSDCLGEKHQLCPTYIKEVREYGPNK